MRMPKLSARFFCFNRDAFCKQLKNNSICLFFTSDEMPRNGDQYFPYRPSSDFFYLSGIEQEKSILLLWKGNGDQFKEEILFILRADENLETWNGHKLTLDEAREISGLKQVKYLDDFDEHLNTYMAKCDHVYLNQNEYPKFFPDNISREKRMNKSIQDKFPLHHYNRTAPVLAKQRVIKSAEELVQIKKAIDITHQAFKSVLQKVKPGIEEYEIEAEILYEFIKGGSSGPAYPSIVASGRNACVLHYVDNDRIMKNGDLLLLDFGSEFNNYAADCSRTIPVSGKFTSIQKTYYNAVLDVFKQAKGLFIPGNTINGVNKFVNNLIEEKLIELGVFSRKDVEKQNKENPLYFKYYMHGTSHFMGLDVHDVGSKDLKFEKGMVLTCEPGLYMKELGFGIRLENDILVDESPIDLMAEIPIEVEEIEDLMNK